MLLPDDVNCLCKRFCFCFIHLSSILQHELEILGPLEFEIMDRHLLRISSSSSTSSIWLSLQSIWHFFGNYEQYFYALCCLPLVWVYELKLTSWQLLIWRLFVSMFLVDRSACIERILYYLLRGLQLVHLIYSTRH